MRNIVAVGTYYNYFDSVKICHRKIFLNTTTLRACVVICSGVWCRRQFVPMCKEFIERFFVMMFARFFAKMRHRHFRFI